MVNILYCYIAVSMPYFILVINVAGSLSVMNDYIYPIVMYLKTHWGNLSLWDKFPGYLIIVFVCIIGVTGTYFSWIEVLNKLK